MKLTLNYKSVFGRDSYYPADEISRIISLIGNFKTFTPHQLDIMRENKWELDIKAEIPD